MTIEQLSTDAKDYSPAETKISNVEHEIAVSSPSISNFHTPLASSPKTQLGVVGKDRVPCLTRSPVFRVDVVSARHEVSIGTESDQAMSPDNHSVADSLLPTSPRVDLFHDGLDDLLDAARCVRAETQLQEAETVVDALIAKFAEPLDLYTAWENLYRSSPMPMMHDQDEDVEYGSTSTKPVQTPTFSPILSLLMAQSGAKIFPQLCQPSSTGKKLLELCKQLAGDIRRLKRKVSLLQTPNRCSFCSINPKLYNPF
ncbi:unnamed protein product [Echinostoma caproni]|uniref:Uncharacterized protein n=1 Tax=Echinostoma caproni TaxID=27848 RepID=A0A183AMI9_9TREM|nr:unnamed protein product [Echinostoma caproni]